MTLGQEVPESGTGPVLNIGVGGATSSGKTTLAKHLVDLLSPGVKAMGEHMPTPLTNQAVVLVHQDDFLSKELPWNETFGAEDWDTPYGAVDYGKMTAALAHVTRYGDLPLWYKTHDHLNELRPLPVTASFRSEWQARFRSLLLRIAEQMRTRDESKPLCIVVTEGFLMYFDPEVRSYMNLKLFIRTPRAEVLYRRVNRGGYVTEAGNHWVVRIQVFSFSLLIRLMTSSQDPPGYFDQVVWPAYQLAHRRVFKDGDVEHGDPIQGPPLDEGTTDEGGPIPDLILIEDRSLSSEQNAAEVERQLEAACLAVESKINELLQT